MSSAAAAVVAAVAVPCDEAVGRGASGNGQNVLWISFTASRGPFSRVKERARDLRARELIAAARLIAPGAASSTIGIDACMETKLLLARAHELADPSAQSQLPRGLDPENAQLILRAAWAASKRDVAHRMLLVDTALLWCREDPSAACGLLDARPKGFKAIAARLAKDRSDAMRLQSPLLLKRLQLRRRGGVVRDEKSLFITYLEVNSTEKFHSFRTTVDPHTQHKISRRPHILVSV